ncbi:protein kinase domain-containing protein [Nocardia cyriacigeorgica]|uniref:serine/threonine-protein kinase n=1 Tax=Nocardia cyriacigeorgica TaxID=135487 RepID=UPI001894696E|nr:serine/threonine-protein kinase [Nocardia cyriacigeorgica]MBF6454576.1 serine/threonine protein kinase [Nocardia cyriacigeorgica]MBF6480267.1 serine/threonine protein kinase [Nocardia cyriacigeorgica]MBF6552470.1 serine/threonine protein kinase [Nocardia cyriacigeorgica]
MGALEPGSVFAGYTIERLLGVGGMGEVYVARHPRLPRSDAIKVLAAQFTRDEQYRRRFEREADLAASLSHPGIVSVHDRGEFDGRLWISLALIDGVDVSALLATAPGGLPATEVARAIAEVADALDYAGARGLVHRDVKPANILLATTGHYLLTDFGIARMGPESSDLTGTGMTIGTIAYAAPEQMQGLPVGPRSDQYALAATAFHLLTGTQPFTGTSPVAVIMAHAQQPVPSVRERRPDLAPQVDAVIARAMAKSPEHRFATSREFAAALGQALAGSAPHHAIPGTASDRYAPTVANPAGGAFAPAAPARPPAAGPTPAVPHRPPGSVGAGSRSARPHRIPLVIAGLVVAVIATIGAVVGIRGYLHDAGAEEAAQLPRRPVTPILPALDKRPDEPVWTLQEIPGPPGSSTLRVSAVGGDSEIVLFTRTVRSPEADWVDYLDIVDAKTGRLVDGTAPILLDDTESHLVGCVVSPNHAAVACDLSGPTDTVLVVDIAASRIIATVPATGDVYSLTAAGDRFVFVDRPDDPLSPLLRVVGLDGRELAPLSGTDIAATTPSGQPRHAIDVFGLARLAMVTSAPDPSNPLSKWEFRVIRLDDGAVILRRESAEQFDDTWNVFIDGFVLGDGDARGIYDRNGTKTADLPAGWRPSQHPYYTQRGPVETSVPTAIKTNGSTTTYAGISPRNGIVLWEQQSYSGDDRPEHLPLRGVGTLLATYGSSRVVDAYTGEYVITGAMSDDGTLLGTDGSRVAIVTESSSAGNRLQVWDSEGQVWDITSEQTAVAVGDKIYLGNLRLF